MRAHDRPVGGRSRGCVVLGSAGLAVASSAEQAVRLFKVRRFLPQAGSCPPGMWRREPLRRIA